MQREIDINEISDGKKYQINDLVKISCNDCDGCSECCKNMSGLITLDPYDIFRLLSDKEKLKLSNAESGFQALLADGRIELTVDRGLLIPCLKMSSQTNACTFLSSEGRCSIHDIRPGICRLFPMGRLYENDSFYYFLQKNECSYKLKTKIKLKNWLDTPEIQKYEKYICDWHYFCSDIIEYLSNASEDEAKQINTAILHIFYITEYASDFYSDFYVRLAKIRALL